MDAQPAPRVGLFQFVQRALVEVTLCGGAHRQVLALGLEVQDIGQRHTHEAAAVVDRERLGERGGG